MKYKVGQVFSYEDKCGFGKFRIVKKDEYEHYRCFWFEYTKLEYKGCLLGENREYSNSTLEYWIYKGYLKLIPNDPNLVCKKHK